MISATSFQLKQLDRLVQEKFGVPTYVLMENAGRAVAETIFEDFKKIKRISSVRKFFSNGVNIFCGKGNNGGDGLVAARHLINKGFKVKVFLIGRKTDLKGEVLINFHKLVKKGIIIYHIPDLKKFSKLKREAKSADLIVDAIFGIGLKGDLKEPFRSIINFLNKTKISIISIDVPSGLDADTGEVDTTAIKAKQTITFSLPKRGFFLNKGPKYTGKIVIKDIGIPKSLVRDSILHKSR